MDPGPAARGRCRASVASYPPGVGRDLTLESALWGLGVPAKGLHYVEPWAPDFSSAVPGLESFLSVRPVALFLCSLREYEIVTHVFIQHLCLSNYHSKALESRN